MAIRANITSIEALEAFRASLIVYLSKAKPALEEVSAEIVRTRVWLQNNQRMHWENVYKRRARDLEEARAALFSAKMSNLREVSSAEQMAVTKARRSLDEAEAKLRVIRKWEREFENLVEPMTRKLEKMQIVLMDDLVKAAVYLGQTVNTLDAYARIVAPSLGGENELAPPPSALESEAVEPTEEKGETP